MPRTARLDGPGMFHHVYARGLERRKIFLNDIDRQDFLERLETVCADGAATVYGWCLMSNHFHLAIRTGAQPLGRTMSRLLTGYAVSFNRSNKRDGHLFQNRFKSTVVDEERYFLALVRYIHLNPVRARLVEGVNGLKNYPWCGHRGLLGKGALVVQDVDAVLGRFGATAGPARRELVKFMSHEDERSERKIFTGGGLVRSAGGMEALKKTSLMDKWAYDERILGSGLFVESVLKQVEAESQMALPSVEERYEKFKSVAQKVCGQAGISMNELTAGGRTKELVRARHALCYAGVKQIGITCAAIGRMLNVSTVAVSKSLKTGEAYARDFNLTTDE